MLSHFARVAARASRARAPPLRAMAPAFSTAPAFDPADDELRWEQAFLDATENIVTADASHETSAAALRGLVRSGLLRHTDLRDRPERFFKAHRLLARHAVQHGPGFWIRFTVHYNLCFGTVLAVGGPEQVAALDAIQDAGELGCFALTEKLAGVQSGLVVETEANYDAAAQQFELHTPNAGAAKNWISQGFVAERAVVLANLTVGEKRVGPHAFLVDMRDGATGALADGVSVADMGVKTTGNDLDNAQITFDRVRLPKASLLNAHCDVDGATGEYVLKTAGVQPFEMIGQRLYTGRVAVAQAALSYRRELFRVTKEYADAKPIPDVSRSGAEPMLSGIPQLRALFAEADATAARLDEFVARCEGRLADLLRDGATPDAALAHAIATAKVKAVEASIDLCGRLKQEVGSYALMGDSGFVHLDFLNCCKFAEGDSRILMQKMARDRLRAYAKAQKAGLTPSAEDAEEDALCETLAAAVARAGADKAAQAAAWDEEWRTVYELAEVMMDRTLRDF